MTKNESFHYEVPSFFVTWSNYGEILHVISLYPHEVSTLCSVVKCNAHTDKKIWSIVSTAAYPCDKT